MAVNQLKTLFEQQITNGSNTLHTMKPPPPMRVPKSAAHASRSSQPQPVNKHPRVQDEKIASPTRASPDYQKANSLPRTAKLSASNSLHMAHRERLEGISGKMTQPVRLNNSSSRPKSPNCIKSNRVVNSHVGALQRSGSAESLTSSNDSDDTRPGRDKLSKLTLRTSSDEDLSLKMAAVGSESPPWGRAVLKKPVSASVDTEPLPQAPPAEGADYLLAAKKALRRTNIDVVLTSTPPLSPSLDGTTPVVRTSAASPNAPSGDDENAVELADEVTELADEVTELGSVGGRIEKFKSQVSTSSLSEQAEEEWDVSSDAGMDDWVFLQKDRGSVDSSGSPFVEENGSPPDLEPPSERRDAKGTAHEGECAAAQTPAMSVGPPDPAKIEKDRKRRQNIAQELLDTEKTYASRLELICVKFHEAVMQFNASNKQLLPEASIQQIFLNVPQIYALSQNILAELQKRMDNWSTHEQLGDVLCKLAPFLKLYSTYTAGFEGAMKTLTEWTSKDKKFDALVKNFDRELGTGLGITSYMLEPIQRIPRYRLLLTDYVKHLPEDSPERADSEKALGIISDAADRSNDRFKELERCNEILSIQRSLQDYEDTLLVPGRFFIRKGLLNKESSKKGASRHMFFLFSDIFLCTVPQSTHSFKLKYELQLKDTIIEDRKAAIIPHAFAVKYITKSFVLGGSCEEEKQEWMATLTVAIHENRKRNSSLRRESRLIREKNPKKLGGMAPIMVNDKSVSMCQLCKEPFTITFRRHHCRACGKVVCGNCLSTKAYLEYLKREDKICSDCCQLLNEDQKVKYVAPTHDKHDGVLDVKGYEEDAILATYVLLQEGKKWNKVWFQLKDDRVLYKFVAHEDVKAFDSKPLPGYSVFPDPAAFQIRLVHKSKRKDLCETFKLDNQVDFDHWVEALQKAVQMEDLGVCSSPSGEPCDTAATI